jgi:hypothetical protein
VPVRLVESGWETELKHGLAASDGRLLLACPFIKRSVIERLLNVTELDEILVVTRFSVGDFARGVSDIAAIRALMTAGADVRGLRALHAKVFVFGDQRAMVTSANLTEAGLAGNIEFGCVSDDVGFVASCDARIRQLHAEGSTTTAQDLDEWEQMVDECLRNAGRNDAIDGLADYGAPPAQPVEPAPEKAPGVNTGRDGWVAESRQAFVKFAGLGSDRVSPTRTVMREIRDSGAFQWGTYPVSQGHPWRVEDGDTLFMSRMTLPDDMMIIGRAIAIAHDPDRDTATAEQVEHRPWLQQWGYLVWVHHPKFIDGTLANGVSLNDLVEELGPLAFASTKRRMLDGEPNIKPRRSYGRHADVALSEEGFALMTQRFEAALARHGSIPDDQVRRLR